MSAKILPDARARERIATDLGTNLLVEAGAGAGKTTAMVGRMLRLVSSGAARVEEIAAVTFTRKAAAELRERFQEALERALLEAADGQQRERIDRALRDIDSGFVGTIHAFCARVLREHPVEARLDPGFREVFGAEEARLRQEAWTRFVEREAAAGSAALERLADCGIRTAQVFELFVKVNENPDVRFEAEQVARPPCDDVRRELERLVDDAATLMPADEPAAGWDGLQTKLRRIRFHRWVAGWDDDVVFLDALGELLGSRIEVTLNRWDAPTADVKRLRARFEAFADADGRAMQVVEQWWAHRYAAMVNFARRGCDSYLRDRVRAGTLTFQDLLVRCAQLLRESAAARRALAQRYPFLLVDEFQDTDPVQAEVLFLLAADDPAAQDWRAARPRPGALFVVGDPKQSIYRFRRADIAIYDLVKRRFERDGAVLELVANFRSLPPIEQLVASVFRGPHPLLDESATPHQAAFAPLHVQRDGRGRIGWYGVAAGSSRGDVVAACDADAVAALVHAQIADGTRAPGDFLLLARIKAHLFRYAQALEARGIPVQVTGAGVSVAEELEELIVLLDALTDPGDPIKTVAALVGLFFGLSHDDLADHAEAVGGSYAFSFLRAQPRAQSTAAAHALQRLHAWWRTAGSEPADVAVARIVQELGLLPYAVAGELGGSRAGSLLYALDVIRAAGLDGDTSLAAARDSLRVALEEVEAEAPLEPGRTDAVRVMNLHKAKGLEAPVVVLIYPAGEWDRQPDFHVRRRDDGSADGFIEVREKSGFQFTTIARPRDWHVHAQEEARYEAAEETRLLYVAATRARDELIVARCDDTVKKSPWRPLYAHLDRAGTRIEIPALAPPPPRVISTDVGALRAAAARAEQERASRARASHIRVAVTDAAKEAPRGERPQLDLFAAGPAGAAPRGRGWGRAVHAALEAAVRGAGEDALRRVARDALLREEQPVGADGEPAELDELLGLVATVRASALWQRALAADQLCVETEFALPLEPTADGTPKTLHGRVDLAFREGDEWVIVDFKSDVVAGAALAERCAAYQPQVDLYAEAWQRITGRPVRERALFFTASGFPHVWAAAAPTQPVLPA